jgi:CrcB protein
VRDRDLTLAAVAAGGAVGTWARLGVAEGLPVEPGHWPWATFAVNLVGAALLGWAGTLLLERTPPTPYRRPFVGSGLCGGLTTFSTLQLEVAELGRDGHAALAAAYLLTSVLFGLALVVAASGVVRRVGLAAA